MEHGNKRGLWEGIIRKWPDSGLSQREYCLRQNLTYSAFRYWYRRLGFGNAPTKSSQQVRAVEVSRKAMRHRTIAMNPVANGEVETDKIVIKLPGAQALVTISGRMSLASLSRIMGVLDGIGRHAEA